MDWQTIINNLIIAFAPVIASIATFVYQSKINEQNNNLQLSLKSQEFVRNQKLVLLNDYIDCLNALVQDHSDKNLSNYYSAMLKVSPFLSEKTFEFVEDINSNISTESYDAIKSDIVKFLPATLNLEIHNYKNNYVIYSICPKPFGAYYFKFPQYC